MIWYLLAIYLHIVAAVLWLGQLLYLAVVDHLVAGLGPPERTRPLRDIHDRLRRLSWPCLCVTLATGGFVLYYQGATLHELLSGRLFLGSFGRLLQIKLLLTAALIGLQFLVGTRRIFLESLLVLIGATIIGMSAVLIR